MNRFVVPVDHSHASWLAFDVAVELAKRADAPITVVEVVFSIDAVDEAAERVRRELAARTADRDLNGVAVEGHAALDTESVAAAIEYELDQEPGSVAVMSSHGRGRSAAVLGSVVDDVLRRTFGPVVVVGPHVADVGGWGRRLDGPIVIAVDGSPISEQTVALGVAWAIELGATPWVTEVIDTGPHPADIVESADAARLAHHAQARAHHDVEYEVLHNSHPAHEITDYAERCKAGLIVAGTHGRTGLERFTLGSVSAAIVRHATVPVVLLRPPDLSTH